MHLLASVSIQEIEQYAKVAYWAVGVVGWLAIIRASFVIKR